MFRDENTFVFPVFMPSQMSAEERRAFEKRCRKQAYKEFRRQGCSKKQARKLVRSGIAQWHFKPESASYSA